MRRTFSLALLALLGSGALSHAVDFTPKVFDKSFPTGATLRLTFFADKGKKFTVSKEVDTELSGTTEEATFRFSTLRGATFSMRNAAEPISFEEKAREALRLAAEAFAPQGAVAEGAWEEAENPISAPGFKSFGFARAYKLPGSTIRQSVTFVNAGPTQDFVLITTAFKAEFKDAAERSQRIIGSWRELREDDFKGPVIN